MKKSSSLLNRIPEELASAETRKAARLSDKAVDVINQKAEMDKREMGKLSLCKDFDMIEPILPLTILNQQQIIQN